MSAAHFRISRLTRDNLEPGSKVKIPLETAYVLVGDACSNSCLFCSFSRPETKDRRKWLSRIDWIVIDPEEFCRLFNAAEEFRRVCFQLPSDLRSHEFIKQLLTARSIVPGKKVSVSAWMKESDIDFLVRTGVDNIALNIDVVSAKTHGDLKGGCLEEKLDFLHRISRKYADHPNLFTTHVIAGTGETDEELFRFFKAMKESGITVGLFSYTRVNRVQYEGLGRPSLKRYRKIQFMKFLCENAESSFDIKFDEKGSISLFNLHQEEFEKLAARGGIFNTSGCSFCTRPYYNDSPSEMEPYNYFSPVEPGVCRKIMDSLPVSFL